MLVRSVAPRLAPRIHQPVVIVAILALAVSLTAIIVAVFPTSMQLVGNGTLAALAAFVGIGIAVGHFLGGPDRDERVVLGLSTGCRHPGMAIAIAAANYPQETRVVAAALLYLIVNITISIAYIVRMRPRSS